MVERAYCVSPVRPSVSDHVGDSISNLLWKFFRRGHPRPFGHISSSVKYSTFIGYQITCHSEASSKFDSLCIDKTTDQITRECRLCTDTSNKWFSYWIIFIKKWKCNDIKTVSLCRNNWNCNLFHMSTAQNCTAKAVHSDEKLHTICWRYSLGLRNCIWLTGAFILTLVLLNPNIPCQQKYLWIRYCTY